ETIQLFIPGRAGMIKDVWIDFSGFMTGFILVTVVRKLRA
ncbi:MAG TPA: VanZ family protein, partial [Lachnospiraceae bacterium]|nr:VanZ family protein [Lachnospiraceae bacterium]